MIHVKMAKAAASEQKQQIHEQHAAAAPWIATCYSSAFQLSGW
jgi:hypothetical protein